MKISSQVSQDNSNVSVCEILGMEIYNLQMPASAVEYHKLLLNAHKVCSSGVLNMQLNLTAKTFVSVCLTPSLLGRPLRVAILVMIEMALL